MTGVEVLVQLDTGLGESPVWDDRRGLLHLVDITGRRLHRVVPDSGAVASVTLEGRPGAIALREDGGLVAAVELHFLVLDDNGDVETRLGPVAVGERMNDGKCDPRGRFLAGTLDGDERPGAAALYRLDPDGTIVTLLDDVALSNGLDWNAAGDRLLYVDTTTERIDQFGYDLDHGSLGARRPWADLTMSPGRPDGLTIDAADGAWVAMARAGQLRRYDRDGNLDHVVDLPTPYVTSCCFGGTELDQLFVTTSRDAVPPGEHDPVAGAVLVITDLGMSGRAPYRFAG